MAKTIKYDFGLGRRKKEDPRDSKFKITAVLPKKAPSITSRNWNANGWWGDQGAMPHCVAFAWVHLLEDGPVTQVSGPAPILDPAGLYKLCQRVDEWPGENYDGTSIRAGAKILQGLGFIGEYRWAWDLDTMINAVLTEGPVTIGTNWYYDMFFPKEKNIIKIGGRLAGGHATVINGVNTKTGFFRLKNSWGRSWGNKGHALISFEDMEKLINQDGEICLPVELKKK
jgi:hypothetical protein